MTASNDPVRAQKTYAKLPAVVEEWQRAQASAEDGSLQAPLTPPAQQALPLGPQPPSPHQLEVVVLQEAAGPRVTGSHSLSAVGGMGRHRPTRSQDSRALDSVLSQPGAMAATGGGEAEGAGGDGRGGAAVPSEGGRPEQQASAGGGGKPGRRPARRGIRKWVWSGAAYLATGCGCLPLRWLMGRVGRAAGGYSSGGGGDVEAPGQYHHEDGAVQRKVTAAGTLQQAGGGAPLSRLDEEEPQKEAEQQRRNSAKDT